MKEWYAVLRTDTVARQCVETLDRERLVKEMCLCSGNTNAYPDQVVLLHVPNLDSDIQILSSDNPIHRPVLERNPWAIPARMIVGVENAERNTVLSLPAFIEEHGKDTGAV